MVINMGASAMSMQAFVPISLPVSLVRPAGLTTALTTVRPVAPAPAQQTSAATAGLAAAFLAAAGTAARCSRTSLSGRAARGRRGSALVCCAAAGDSLAEQEVTLMTQVLREVKELVVLQKCSKEIIQKLAESMVLVRAAAGEVIVSQGGLDPHMYVVASGEVVIQREQSGGEEPLQKGGAAGSYFGAESMLGNTPQKVTVIAQSECQLCRLDRDVFDAAILSQNDVQEDLADEEEEEEDDNASCSTSDIIEVFVVSDSTGESASASVRTAMQQFNYCSGSTCGVSRTTVFRFMKTEGEARKIVAEAKERNALVVFTVMQTKLNIALTAACEEQGVHTCDLWGALLTSLEKKFGVKRSGITGRKQSVGDEYMRIVRAIEYTRKVDDGVCPNAWKECDIMLIGPSRAGKTPLSFYLAQRGFKVANYPLVPDEEPPKELLELDQDKCFALMISADKLAGIRAERMKQFNRTNTSYADLSEIKKEVNWMKQFYMRKGPRWPIIDTTNAGVVETAARIMEILDSRKGDSLAASYVSPVES
ncbi:unnamed protein product [Polarella glacialis]|uniref:Cyclic nucleotide-binding domain-containing protein n=1 Tax=Polarella glacialis TaxID=89957 RepID=A0A813DRY1_POLGL|nr:unnamed protein product [Polarella glacialis]